jgi:hypothetical protein
MRRVVITMPEAGLEELPTIPTVIDVTAVKKYPKMVKRMMVKRFKFKPGKSQRKRMMISDPRIKNPIEISRSVLGVSTSDLKP